MVRLYEHYVKLLFVYPFINEHSILLTINGQFQSEGELASFTPGRFAHSLINSPLSIVTSFLLRLWLPKKWTSFVKTFLRPRVFCVSNC